MIYALESEVRKNGLATVVLFSFNQEKKNPVMCKNQEYEESFLNKISGGNVFQRNGQNLYVVAGRAYQIVAGLKTYGYGAEIKLPWIGWEGIDHDVQAAVRMLLDVRPNTIYFEVKDQKYDPIKVLEWNLAQLHAFRFEHPRSQNVYWKAYRDDETYSLPWAQLRVLLEEYVVAFSSDDESSKSGLPTSAFRGLTFFTKSDVR